MEENTKFVRFDIWCKQCKHFNVKEVLDPCDECLACPARESTEKPLNFEANGKLKNTFKKLNNK